MWYANLYAKTYLYYPMWCANLCANNGANIDVKA